MLVTWKIMMVDGKTLYKLCQINVDGLSSHSQIAIDRYISENRTDILALQEVGHTHPEEEIFSNMLSSWHVGCHGVGISVNPKLNPQPVIELSNPEIDSVFCLCNINNKGVMFVSCYCRPEISSTKSLKQLLKNLDDAWLWCLSKQVRSMVVLGDFNARSTKWGDSICNARGKVLSAYVEDKSDICLHSAASNTFLTSGGGSIIDLTLSYGEVTSYLSTPWTEKCYSLFTGAPGRGHLPVFQTLEVLRGKGGNLRKVPDYDAADWDSWCNEMENVFTVKLQNIELNNSNNSPKDLFKFFLDQLHHCNEKFIPLKSVCSHSKPFWCDKLSKLSKELQIAQKDYQFKSDPVNKKILEACKDKFQESLITERNKWIHKKLDGLNTKDSVEFWKRYKKQFVKKSEPSISHLYSDKALKSLVFENAEKEAILFKTFFTGEHLNQFSFDEEYQKLINTDFQNLVDTNWGIAMNGNSHGHYSENIADGDSTAEYSPSSSLNEMITYSDVIEAIKVQKTSGKCCDANKFHPLFLKKLTRSPITFLTHLFNQVFKSGEWAWDCSMVSFIRKTDKDSYLVPGAYRPISIASYVGKIFERILQKRLLHFCQQEMIIDDAQEGFLPHRNTTRYLYKMNASVAEARRRKMSAMLLFLDFEKAFDSVPVTSLIVKLHRYGISGAFLQLIHSFLTKREVTLKVNEYIGPRRKIGKYGLPQGSVLSPLLFIIFVADLLSPKDMPVQLSKVLNCYKYADDGSILVTADSTTNCHLLMQEACNYLHEWCKKWRLIINCSKNKTEAIIIKSKDSASTIVPKLKIGTQVIDYVKKSKVLGVIIDEDLKYDHHAKTVLKNCWYTWHRLSDKTTRKKGLNSVTLAILFKTAVMTKLLYASPVWLLRNLGVFSDLMSRALLKITGAQVYIPKVLAQTISNIPPLPLTLELITVKFCLKALTADNEMRALMMQLEEIPSHPFYVHTVWMRRYIAVKKSQQTYRSISLHELPLKDLYYTKDVMNSYLCQKWDDCIRKSDMMYLVGKDAFSSTEDLDKVKTSTISVCPLLSHIDKRTFTSDTLDFLHGRCIIFSSFKNTLGLCNDDCCEDCGMPQDNSIHKLFYCTAFDGATRNSLIHLMDHDDFSKYCLDVVFGSNDIKTAFRDHVQFILRNTISDDGYNNY